jgi:hypothetical protein
MNNGLGKGHIGYATDGCHFTAVLFMCRGCANNQPVMRASDTQEHVDLITMARYCSLKNKENSAFCNS